MSRALFAARPGISADTRLRVFVYIGYLGGGPVFVTVPASARSISENRGTVAVLLYGDMGFSIGMGPQIADRIAARGIPVLGVNSLAYFRVQRTRAEARALLTAAVAKALSLSGARRVVLIGQSFGADQLQAALPTLPETLRRKVLLVVLVVPLDTVAYRASPSEIFSIGTPKVASLPTARKLTWSPVLCIQGAEETDSLCPLLSMPNVTRVSLPGGHPMHRDSDRVFATIMLAIEREMRR